MGSNRIEYPGNHWIRSGEPQKALQAYLEQQSKTYSKIKNAYVRELLGSLKDKDFLDYGCGAGMFLVYGAKQGASRIVGIEAEKAVLKTAAYFMETEGFKDRCELIHAEHWPCFPEDRKFDVILLKDVIEHVKEDDLLLERASKSLKPGGFIVLSTQNSFSLNYLLEGSWEYFFRKNKNWRGWDLTHFRFYRPGTITKKFKKAGLHPVEWRSAYIIPYKFPPFSRAGKAYIRLDFLGHIDRIFGRIPPFCLMGWNTIVKGVAVNRSSRTMNP